MGNKPYDLPTRADWSTKILNYLFSKLDEGVIPLNQFAADVLKINPEDTTAGHEFDRVLQAMEDLHQIFYKAKEKTEGGFKKRSLNAVEFSATLQFDGYRLMADKQHNWWMIRITAGSVIVALVAALISLAAVFVQINGKTDTELKGLNLKSQAQVRILQDMQQSQKAIDASLRRIADTLSK